MVIGRNSAGVTAGFAVLLVGAVLVWSGRVGDGLVPDRYGNREYALDALALQYLADFTDDEWLIRREASMFWCLTPVLEEMDRLEAEERSRVALRMRARAMVVRAGGEPKDVPLADGDEPTGQFIYPLR